EEEADPGEDGQARHEQAAKQNAEDGKDGATGAAESAMAIGLAVTKDEDARRNEHEGEERTDVREVRERADVEQSRGNADDEARDPGGDVGSAEARVDFGKH